MKSLFCKRLLIGEFSGKRLLMSPLLILVCVYLFLFFYAWLFSDSIIFQPPGTAYDDLPDLFYIEVENGQKIAACYRTVADPKAVILFNHGNAENLAWLGADMAQFTAHGYSILAYDYRGYGQSDGHVSEKNTYADVLAAFDHLVEKQNVQPQQIIAYGRSLGSGPATELCRRRELGGLVLEGAFTSAFRVVTQIRILPFDKFDNLGKLDEFDEPVLVIHGTQDKVVPFRHGKALYAAAGKPKFHLWVEGAGHMDAVQKAGVEFWQQLENLRQNEKTHAGASAHSKR